jgi:hypothetical protein
MAAELLRATSYVAVFGQLSGKPLFALIHVHGVPNVNHNRIEKISAENLTIIRRGPAEP